MASPSSPPSLGSKVQTHPIPLFSVILLYSRTNLVSQFRPWSETHLQFQFRREWKVQRKHFGILFLVRTLTDRMYCMLKSMDNNILKTKATQWLRTHADTHTHTHSCLFPLTAIWGPSNPDQISESAECDVTDELQHALISCHFQSVYVCVRARALVCVLAHKESLQKLFSTWNLNYYLLNWVVGESPKTAQDFDQCQTADEITYLQYHNSYFIEKRQHVLCDYWGIDSTWLVRHRWLLTDLLSFS